MTGYAHAASYTPDEIEECTIGDDLMRNKTIMRLLKQIIIVVCLASTCCLATLCSYNQLERKYQKLENKR